MKKSFFFWSLLAFWVSSNTVLAQETAFNVSVSARTVWICKDSVDVVMNLETNNLYVTIGTDDRVLTEFSRPADISSPVEQVYMARTADYLLFADTRRGEISVVRLTMAGTMAANIEDLTRF